MGWVAWQVCVFFSFPVFVLACWVLAATWLSGTICCRGRGGGVEYLYVCMISFAPGVSACGLCRSRAGAQAPPPRRPGSQDHGASAGAGAGAGASAGAGAGATGLGPAGAVIQSAKHGLQWRRMYRHTRPAWQRAARRGHQRLPDTPFPPSWGYTPCCSDNLFFPTDKYP